MDIVYQTSDFSDSDLNQACDLVNSAEQLTITLTPQRLKEIFFLVLAKAGDQVVGVSCIKADASVAEIGYTAVSVDFRRRRIGTRLTEVLLENAKNLGVPILSGLVHAANHANCAKLEKLEFTLASEYRSPLSGEMMRWYAYVIDDSLDAAKIMQEFLDARMRRVLSRV